MRGLSLKAGLSWLIGIVLVATLLINVSILIVRAGSRIRVVAERNQSLSRGVLVTAVRILQDTEGDPLPALRRLCDGLSNLRDVDIEILSSDHPSAICGPQSRSRAGREIPDWFVSLMDTPPKITIIPVTSKRLRIDRITIRSNPIDELGDIWSDVSSLALAGLGVTLLVLTLVLLLLRFSLEPFNALRHGLADLEAGKSNVRIALRGAAEFRGISAALNSLAATLDRVRHENRTLVNELIQVQDNERKEIARDLHDEAGPCLFSIRAGAVTLIGLASEPAPDPERVRQICVNVNKASEALQRLFRELLGRLRPSGLAEFGLNAVLNGLVVSWNASRPDVTLDLKLPHDLGSLDEAIALAAYRVVQEAVTNVFRHAGADWAQVRIEFEPGAEPENSDLNRECAPALHISIEDNGVGIPEQRKMGLGLLGMSERVQALGGTIKIERRATGGTLIDVSLPLQGDEEHDP